MGRKLSRLYICDRVTSFILFKMCDEETLSVSAGNQSKIPEAFIN